MAKLKIILIGITFLLSLKSYSLAQVKEDTIKIEGKVVFLTIDEIYFDIGLNDGLSINDTVFIFRNGIKIDSLIITEISERHSKAKIGIEKAKNIKVGDIVVAKKIKRKIAEQAEKKSSSGQVETNNIKTQTPLEETGLKKELSPKEPIIKSHGRISVQNYSLFSPSYKYQRPAFLLIANFDKIFVDNLKINSYSKIEYNLQKNNTWTNRQTRFLIYQLSIEYHLANFTFSAGRIFPYSSPGIGGTDGIQLTMQNQFLSFGFIAGTQPQMDNNSINLSNTKFSFFVSKDFRNSSISGRTSISYSKVFKDKKLDEEFIYIQNFIRISRLTDLYLSSQIDLNQLSGGQRVKKPTFRNLFASFGFSPFNWIRFSLDLNTYRNIYLFETMKNLPDSLIDKRFRRDLRGRFYINLPLDITLNLTTSLRLIQGENHRDSFTSLYTNISDIFSSGLDISAGLSYVNTRFSKILGKEISFEKFFWNRDIGLNCNLTSYTYTTSAGEKFTNSILRIGFLFNISRNYNFLIDFERNWQKSANTSIVFAEISYKF